MEDKVQKQQSLEGIQGQDKTQTESGPYNGTEINEDGEPSSHDIDG